MPNEQADTKGADYIGFPIAAKLVSIITVLVVLSLGAITALVTWHVSADVRVTAEETNHTVNTRSAVAAENELSTIRANVFLLLDLINAAGASGPLARQATAFFFERNQNIAAILLTDAAGTTRRTELVNNRFFLANETELTAIGAFAASESDSLSRVEAGEVMALNASVAFGMPVMALVYPWTEWGYRQALVILFSTESLAETFGTGSLNSSFMVNHRGDLLVHPDADRVTAGVNLRDYPLVTSMREDGSLNRQILFRTTAEDADRPSELFGSWRLLSFGDLAVLTTVESAVVFEGVKRTTIQNIWLTLAVLFVAILFIWFFSKSISRPVRRLASASGEIARGNFNITISTRSRDELGLLTRRFGDMARGLAERERLKDTFGRFINPEIAEKAARGELTLGGETKTATIFFSDIRSFTAISEKLEPFEVVEFLNDYMTRMVTCVNTTGGVVDKFIGDAVMAVWGAPVSAGSPAADALNCVRSALLMRAALIEFNKGRGGDKKPVISIGAGINTGELIAGQIGSQERMEYTVIGDAVNLASRIESLNKPLCTDILISENTRRLVGDAVLTEEMPSVSVKGKSAPVRLFAVVNMPDARDIPGAGPDGPSSLQEVRALLGLATPDFKKVNLDADEQKYKIQD